MLGGTRSGNLQRFSHLSRLDHAAMLFMVVERYTKGPQPVYERAAKHGRMLPERLSYIESWVVDDDRMDRCFQLMETDDPELFDEWLDRWRDLGEFEIYTVVGSQEAASRTGVVWPEPAGD